MWSKDHAVLCVLVLSHFMLRLNAADCDYNDYSSSQFYFKPYDTFSVGCGVYSDYGVLSRRPTLIQAPNGAQVFGYNVLKLYSGTLSSGSATSCDINQHPGCRCAVERLTKYFQTSGPSDTVYRTAQWLFRPEGGLVYPANVDGSRIPAFNVSTQPKELQLATFACTSDATFCNILARKYDSQRQLRGSDNTISAMRAYGQSGDLGGCGLWPYFLTWVVRCTENGRARDPFLFLDTSKDALPCVAVTQCEPGFQPAAEPKWNTDVICVPCPSGTFKSAKNNEQCQAWKAPCSQPFYQSAAPTDKRDRSCTPCTVCKHADRQYQQDICRETTNTVSRCCREGGGREGWRMERK